MALKLFNAVDNFVVESMCIGDSTVEFVHDTETGNNFFAQRTMRSMLGLSSNTVSKHCKNFEKQLNNFSQKSGKAIIKLKTNNSNQRIKFYSFDGLTYVVYRSNSDKAMEVRNLISSVLNKMFNVVTGKDSINSNKSWLKQQCEVKQVQAMKYKGASKLLYEADGEHDAKKIYSKYKKLEAEALKFKEMYLDYERLDKEVATVRTDKTEQLKLI